MNPGVVEEGGKVATGVIEALKSQPIALALIVMNIIFVGAVGLGAHALNIRTTQRYQAQDELIHKLIAQCLTKSELDKALSVRRSPPILKAPG